MHKRPKYTNSEIARVQRVKNHVFRGNRYKVEVVHLLKSDKAHGLTDNPKLPGKTMRIDPDQHGRRLMQTLLDESIHCCMFELDNDTVEEMAEGISKFLWRCGFRIVPRGSNKKR